uniref:Uncharacterized protein n=1 Tax=Cucumis sativus TaxID=3659 RepID=A0A0A0LMV3_CUCSA
MGNPKTQRIRTKSGSKVLKCNLAWGEDCGSPWRSNQLGQGTSLRRRLRLDSGEGRLAREWAELNGGNTQTKVRHNKWMGMHEDRTTWQNSLDVN